MFSTFRTCANILQRGAVALIFASVAAGAPAGVSLVPTNKSEIMKSSSTYPVRYSNPARSCSIQAVTKARGVVTWSSELGVAPSGGRLHLLIWEGKVVVVVASEIALFSPDGRRSWNRTTGAGSPVAVTSELLYYEARGFFLEAVDFNNVLALQKAPFPGVANEEFHVDLFWPREKDFVAATSLRRPTYDTEDRTTKRPLPKVLGRRAVFGEVVSEWGADYDGINRLPPLFIPSLEQLVFCLDEVITIDLRKGEEASRCKLPIEKPTDWSADPQGTLCVIGSDGAHKVMLALSPAGDEKWRWVDREGTDGWIAGQPPIRFVAGRVYALTEKRVLAIEQGKLLWGYEPKDAKPAHGSSLGDGSLLVTAGTRLLHLDATGKLKFEVLVDGEIHTPPVVDTDGNIYVATASHLVKIQ